VELLAVRALNTANCRIHRIQSDHLAVLNWQEIVNRRTLFIEM
jgi:hypothetical protein